MSLRDLDDEECAAVLAGLRLLQLAIEGKRLDEPLELINEILTDGGRLNRPNSEDIDGLCERVNLSKD